MNPWKMYSGLCGDTKEVVKMRTFKIDKKPYDFKLFKKDET